MRPTALLLFLSVLAGCASGPGVGSDSLPVRRVVLYRNGVGYFERGGHFHGRELTFGVRQSEVGDFLSSLTAIERTEGGVRSVSFQVPEPPAPTTPLPGIVAPPPASPQDPAGPRMDVHMRLARDADHDLTVAYVVGSPIWRPSYRIVLDDHDALLQAWAVVQNTSGEDWRDVSLSLTTGSPIAFRSDLGTPITPQRPSVSDTGEVIAAVPLSETAIAQGQGGASAGDSDGELAAAESQTTPMAAPSAPMGGATRNRPAPPPRAAMMMDGRFQQQPVDQMNADQLQRSVSSMAGIAVLGEGVTRYDLDGTVTVPDGGSTMVAVLSKRVPGAAVHLFAPDSGVPLSFQHPFRVVRVENRTGAILERGPISVYGSGAFLGQGLLEPLPRGATAFVPFAVDRSVVVETSSEFGEQEGRLVRITRGQVIVERFSERKTHYHVRNGGDEAVKVYVRHARLAGADIIDPPEGAELTPGNALLPVTAPPRGESELVVVERTPVERTFDFLTQVAADAVGLYLQGPAIDAAQGAALRRALDLRNQLITQRQRLEAAQAQRNQITADANETRQNLDSVRQIASAADLRDRLVRRLSQLDQQMGDTTRTIVDAQTNVSELSARLNEALQDVTLDAHTPPAAAHGASAAPPAPAPVPAVTAAPVPLPGRPAR